jgi:hypothetical protein
MGKATNLWGYEISFYFWVSRPNLFFPFYYTVLGRVVVNDFWHKLDYQILILKFIVAVYK